MDQILDKLDFMATDLNDKLDMLYFDTFELFDEKINPDDFRMIRHAISGDTYELYKKLTLKNSKGKESKWKSVYQWVFDGIECKPLWIGQINHVALERYYDEERKLNFKSNHSSASDSSSNISKRGQLDNSFSPPGNMLVKPG